MGEARRKQEYRDKLAKENNMALSDSEKRALVALLRADIKDELKLELQQQRADEQASNPHAGNVGPSGDPGEETNKTLSAIADALGKLHARMDELEKGEKEPEDLKSEDRTKSIEELKELADAMGESAGELNQMGEPKPLVADSKADSDYYADMRKQPDHIIDAHVRNVISKIQSRADRLHAMQNSNAPRALDGETPRGPCS